MNGSARSVAGLLTFCMLLSMNSVSQLADSGNSWKHISILNDKFSFQFPQSSVVSPRVADIMAADPNINRETRVILDRGDMRLVILAQELYALGGKSMFDDISKEVEPEFEFRRKIMVENDSLLGVLSTPTKFDSTSGATLINSLLVRSPDNTVSRVDAFINPAAFQKKDEYVLLTDSIFNSIKKGQRRINLSPKEETYKIFGADSKFSFSLPAGFYVTVDEKYDFGVFRIKKFKNSLVDTVYTGITIYAGHFPSFIHKEYGYTIEKAGKIQGLFLQAPMEWLSINDAAQSFFLKEQFIQGDLVQKDLKFHVAMLTNKKESLNELTRMIEEIKLVK